MTLQEILDEISEKYPHGLTNESVIRKINIVQNELFRTLFRKRTMSIYNIQKDMFAYSLPFPQFNIMDVVVDGTEYIYQDTKKKGNVPFYYFIGKDVIGLYPTPDKDIVGGLSLFYNIYPKQLSESDLAVVPDLDQDFHMLLVYGPLVHICESFNDVAMVNNFTNKYNGIVTDYMKIDEDTPDYLVIEDVMGGLL